MPVLQNHPCRSVTICHHLPGFHPLYKVKDAGSPKTSDIFSGRGQEGSLKKQVS